MPNPFKPINMTKSDPIFLSDEQKKAQRESCKEEIDKILKKYNFIIDTRLEYSPRGVFAVYGLTEKPE